MGIRDQFITRIPLGNIPAASTPCPAPSQPALQSYPNPRPFVQPLSRPRQPPADVLRPIVAVGCDVPDSTAKFRDRHAMVNQSVEHNCVCVRLRYKYPSPRFAQLKGKHRVGHGCSVTASRRRLSMGVCQYTSNCNQICNRTCNHYPARAGTKPIW